MPHSVHTILQDAKKVYDEAMICPYRIKLLTIAALAMLSIPAAAATADDLALIPQPRSVRLTAETTVRPSDTVPHVTVDPLFTPLHGHPEGYLLTVSRDGITIEATDSTGAIRARQTLRQLRRPDGSYPLVRITDWPEFPIRGFMYDDGRNFAGVDRIKSYLDLMGAYKLNVFQWHLTDRPAWRIESKAYPRPNDGKFQRPGVLLHLRRDTRRNSLCPGPRHHGRARDRYSGPQRLFYDRFRPTDGQRGGAPDPGGVHRRILPGDPCLALSLAAYRLRRSAHT